MARPGARRAARGGGNAVGWRARRTCAPRGARAATDPSRSRTRRLLRYPQLHPGSLTRPRARRMMSRHLFDRCRLRKESLMASHGSDAELLAEFGYKQELHRTLGGFSSFAAGFSYISILTGMFQLFYFGFAFGGPAFFWTWPMVFIGQMMVCLCFAELAGVYPIAGSVYNWSKHLGSKGVSWMAGWMMLTASIVTVAAVALAWQIILPQISSKFQIVGDGTGSTDFAKNAVLLGTILIIFTTVVNMIGVGLMAKINNFGVAAELIGATLLVILLAVHITRGPAIVTKTYGTGVGHDWGYFGAFLVASLMSAYVMYGFDTAGSLAEETNEPRKHAPKSLVRALSAAGLLGGLLILVALMSVSNPHDPQMSI